MEKFIIHSSAVVLQRVLKLGERRIRGPEPRNSTSFDCRSTLDEARTAPADMATMIIIGAATTRLIEREGRLPFVYTPRSVTL
jgi:precorrin-3B methylase